jgi:hypothetical protein
MERGLDPLTTNLVVADKSRTDKTICLAVSPSLKSYGIPGRARLFEVVQKVNEVNAIRKERAPGRKLTGVSQDARVLACHPEYAVDYITAVPQMAHYIKQSTKIYNVYLKYVAPEDIHVYSIDEVFMDVTDYLKTYKLTARELVMNMILMNIVILYKLRKIEITGLHMWLVLIVPILTNVFISSRGEFIQTILLELFYIYLLVKNEPNRRKTIFRVIVLVAVLIGAYFYVFHYLYYINDSVRYGIDRLSTISDTTSVDGFSTEEADTMLRPFFRADVFWKRFKHSPLWGAGYSFGEGDFFKSADGYHNDWFRILASTGIAGFCCWIAILKKFVKKTSILILLPFLLAGLSNTFLRSTHALTIYFFLLGAVMHLSQEDAKTENSVG